MEIKGTDKFWNPVLETLTPMKLKQLQLKKLKRIVEWTYQNSGPYQRLYDKAGFKPEDLKDWDDISRIPIVHKEDLRKIQRKEPWPYGESLCVPLDEVTSFHQTTGLTGQPVYQPDTMQDWELRSESWSYALWAQGFRKTDRVFIPFGYNVYMASWAGHYACEKVGCEVVPGGILNTEERLLKMKELRATAFMANPSYVLNMADVCQNKLNIEPAELGIQKILCSGEPGANIPTTKKKMEDAWSAKVYDHVATTEAGGWAYECMAQPGGVHVNEAFYLVELVDINTEEPIVELHMPGKIIITVLDRYAQPCIRFDTRDVAMWGKPCECGRTFRVIKGGVHGRADHITKVKGVLFSPTSVDEVIRSITDVVDDYELVVTKDGDIDELILKVEIVPGTTAGEEVIKHSLSQQLLLRTNLHFNIEIHPFGTLLRPHIEVNRFKDLRNN
jgi:phenylacetate-CoA ligase